MTVCATHRVSLSNAFTSAFKELDTIPQFKATAKLGSFLESLRLGDLVASCSSGSRRKL